MTTTKVISVTPEMGTFAPEFRTANTVDVPKQLWLRQYLIIVAALLVALAGFKAYLAYDTIVRTIGTDSVPSIAAAEKISTQLADAHTNIINAFLIDESGQDGNSRQAYKDALNQSFDALVGAAQNITYGEEERQPIMAVLTYLARYEQLIGMAEQARLQPNNARVSTELLNQSDAVMREQILPSTAGLETANFKHLDTAFSEGRRTAQRWLYALMICSLFLGAILLETQFRLYVSFRRLLNPFLVVSSIVFVLATLLFVGCSRNIATEMRTAKEDAFDSVLALSKAKSLAYSANAQESVYLLMHDQLAKAHQTALFKNVVDQLYSGTVPDVANLPTDFKSLKGQGLLANELANITFHGEEAKAKDTLEGWLQYVQIDNQIRLLEEAGKHDAAVALCIGTMPMQSDWAFEQFMSSLNATLTINQTEFDAGIAHSNQQLSWLWMLLIPMVLLPLIGSALGLQLRLAEYRD